MALNYGTNPTFTGRITAPDANYPQGSSKDETAPGANDGMPYVKQRADDLLGMQQALLLEAGITPSGSADTALSSDYLDAMKKILKSGRKNALINGCMRFSQRGNNFTTLANQYGLDRWQSNITAGSGVGTVSQDVATPGTPNLPESVEYFLRHNQTVAWGVNVNFLQQKIESVKTLANEKVVVSFLAKAAGTQSVKMRVEQFFGTGGSPSATVIATEETVNLTSSWQAFEFTFDMPSISGKTIGSTGDDAVIFLFRSEAADPAVDFHLANAQVEAGQGVATDFEYRPIAEELALCQRYYQIAILAGQESFTGAVSGFLAYTPVVEMRALPTITNLDTQAVIGGGYPTITNNPSANSVPGQYTRASASAAGDKRALYVDSVDAEL